VNNKRQGFWKTYWIIKLDGESNTRHKRGNIKSIIEYKDDLPCNLLAEYYSNGNLRTIGCYENYPTNRYDTIRVIDWSKKSNGEKLKDTAIHTTVGVRQSRIWHYFSEDGTLLK
jgi:antitoxin component YwqK of YwqJK toxin-antitoxin module